MFRHLSITVVGLLVLLIANGTPAMAQRSGAAPGMAGGPAATNPGNLTDSRANVVTRGIPTRLRPEQRKAQVARVTPAVPSEVRAAIRDLADETGVDCQLVDSRRVGFDPESKPIYEAACASDFGYLFVAGSPPTIVNCLQLSSTARSVRERDPSADVGALCMLPANSNMVPVVAALASRAGVTCQVDDALAVGDNRETTVYEIGCAGADGYWLQKDGSGFKKTECLQIVASGETCGLTTAAEQAASVNAWLSATPSLSCDVTRARYMGRNEDSAFYEAGCASGDGYVAQVDDQKAVRRTVPCTEAQSIGGGCTLTRPAPAGPAATR